MLLRNWLLQGMLLASRDVIGGVAWANTLTGDDVDKQVEKGKSNFAGCEIKGQDSWYNRFWVLSVFLFAKCGLVLWVWKLSDMTLICQLTLL